MQELGSSPARGKSGGNRTNSDVAQRQSSAVMAWLLKPLAVKQMSRVYTYVCSHGPCSMQLLLRFSNRSNNRSGTSKGGRLTGTVLWKNSRVWRLIRTKALHHKKLPESRDPQALLHQSNVTLNINDKMPHIEHRIMGKLGSNRGVVRQGSWKTRSCWRVVAINGDRDDFMRSTGQTCKEKLFGENGHANIAYVYWWYWVLPVSIPPPSVGVNFTNA